MLPRVVPLREPARRLIVRYELENLDEPEVADASAN
jgi:hypothetical protein